MEYSIPIVSGGVEDLQNLSGLPGQSFLHTEQPSIISIKEYDTDEEHFGYNANNFAADFI